MDGKYCIYLRKSRADENAFGGDIEETLGRHERTLLALGKQMNLNITKIYREVVSGDTIACRPVIQELLSDVEAGMWSGVLVMEIERLARGDTIDQGIISQTFKYSQTNIITPIKTYNTNNEFDEEYFEFGLFMSRREYKVINRRLQRGRNASVKEGKYLGSKAPYGYKRIKIDNGKGYTLAINESEVNTVKFIFKMYTEGILNEQGEWEHIGVSKICNQLDENGIKPRISKSWSAGTVRGILTNPVYIGKIRWNYRKTINKMVDGQKVKKRPRSKIDDCILVDGIHPPIISNDIFNKAQYYMQRNTANPIGKKLHISNPLAGIIVCSECGHKMIRRPYTNNTPEGLICTTRGCNNVGSALSYVEDRIVQSLSVWLKKYQLPIIPTEIDNNNVFIDIQKNKLNTLNIDFSKLEIQINNLHDLLEQEVYSVEIFKERSKIISKKMAEIERQRSNIEKMLKKVTAKNLSIKEFIPRQEKILNIYTKLEDPEPKNKVLKEIIEKVIYTKHKRGTAKNPDEFEIIIFPRLPDSKIKSSPK